MNGACRNLWLQLPRDVRLLIYGHAAEMQMRKVFAELFVMTIHLRRNLNTVAVCRRRFVKSLPHTNFYVRHGRSRHGRPGRRFGIFVRDDVMWVILPSI